MVWFNALTALLAVGLALLARPWRLLAGAEVPWPWFAWWAMLPLWWCADVLAHAAVIQPMSGVCLLLLMAGWPLAILALVPVAAIAALLGGLGAAEALARMVWLGVVPATLAFGLGAAVRRWLPHHLFVYILGRGFFASLLALALSGWAALAWLGPPGGTQWADLVVGRFAGPAGGSLLGRPPARGRGRVAALPPPQTMKITALLNPEPPAAARQPRRADRLTSLAPEILRHVASSLPARDRASLAAASRSLRSALLPTDSRPAAATARRAADAAGVRAALGPALDAPHGTVRALDRRFQSVPLVRLADQLRRLADPEFPQAFDAVYAQATGRDLGMAPLAEPLVPLMNAARRLGEARMLQVADEVLDMLPSLRSRVDNCLEPDELEDRFTHAADMPRRLVMAIIIEVVREARDAMAGRVPLMLQRIGAFAPDLHGDMLLNLLGPDDFAQRSPDDQVALFDGVSRALHAGMPEEDIDMLGTALRGLIAHLPNALQDEARTVLDERLRELAHAPDPA